jgi:hypothetical protein
MIIIIIASLYRHKARATLFLNLIYIQHKSGKVEELLKIKTKAIITEVYIKKLASIFVALDKIYFLKIPTLVFR